MTNFGGRRPSVEYNLQWKPSVEDDLQWKTSFGGTRPLVEHDLRWNTTFSVRQPSLDPCMLPTPLCSIFLYKVSLCVCPSLYPRNWSKDFDAVRGECVEKIVHETIVHGTSCPRRLLSNGQLSKQTLVQGKFCPRSVLTNLS